MIAAFLLGYVTAYVHWRALVLRDAMRDDDRRNAAWRLDSPHALSDADFFDPPPYA